MTEIVSELRVIVEANCTPDEMAYYERHFAIIAAAVELAEADIALDDWLDHPEGCGTGFFGREDNARVAYRAARERRE